MQETSTQRRKRAQVVVACNACRRRKIKCDGTRPNCQACVARQAVCVYDADPDATPIIALRRKYEQLQRDASRNKLLLQRLRTASDSESAELLRHIRSHSSDGPVPSTSTSAVDPFAWEQQYSYVGESSEADPNSYQPNTTSQPLSTSPQPADEHERVGQEDVSLSNTRSGTSAARIGPLLQYAPRMLPPPSVDRSRSGLTDLSSANLFFKQSTSTSNRTADWALSRPPVSQSQPRPRLLLNHNLQDVKARAWGIEYADDDDLCGILISYFTWDHPTWRFFDEDLFLDGLVDGGSYFCSRLLLHAVMAYGSKNYTATYPTARAGIEHFALVEAKKIFEFESCNDSPATVAAGFLIQATMCSGALDKVGYAYIAQAAHMAQNMGLHSERGVSRVIDNADPRVVKAMAVLAWGTFAYQSYNAINFQDLPLFIRPPAMPLPEKDRQEDERSWASGVLNGYYPPNLGASIFRARAALHVIANEVMPTRARYEARHMSADYLRETLELHGRLSNWYSSLPFPLPFLDGASPHLLALHTSYHQIVVELLRPFVQQPPRSASGQQNSEFGQQQHTQAQHEPSIGVYNASCRQLRYLIYQLDQLYPTGPLPINFSAPLLHVAFETMQCLPSISASDPMADTEPETFFVLCVRILRRMAEPFVVVRFLLRGIRRAAARMAITLPVEAVSVFEELDRNRPQIAGVDVARSSLPVDLSLLPTDLEASKLENVMRSGEDVTML